MFTQQQADAVAAIIGSQVETKHHPKAQQMHRIYAHAFIELFKRDNPRFDSWSFLRACGIVVHPTPADEGIAAAKRDAQQVTLDDYAHGAAIKLPVTLSEARTLAHALSVAADTFAQHAWEADRDNTPRVAEQFRKQRREALELVVKLDDIID